MPGGSASSRNESSTKYEPGTPIRGNQGNESRLRPKRTVRAPARYKSAREDVTGTSVDVHIIFEATKKKNGKSAAAANSDGVLHAENSKNSVNDDPRVSVREYPTTGLPFDTPMITVCP
ncbi:uncharacterized protein LOC113353846 [Papaver somniferum]|uniref:uncharacterized protein LOC113353846 n=1 Tax=Papaver somniferum TaxID=3469 RepID=UPI000E6FCB5F|nr:uncharacterized protein LOC113353846 [Papaver somniferum]